MDIGHMLQLLAQHGLAVARYVHDNNADGLDMCHAKRQTLRAIARAFYGPCRERKLRQAVTEVASTYSVDRLEVLVKIPAQLSKNSPVTPWELRLELTEFKGDVDKLAAYAKRRVRELNATSGKTPPRSLVISHAPDATGRRTALFKLPEAEMARLERTLREMIRQRGRVPEDIAMGNALWAMLSSGSVVSSSVVEPTVLLKSTRMKSCGGGWLQSTDGTRQLASEYAAREIAKHGWVLLYDSANEPVDLWRTERIANAKQRKIIAVDQGTCAWPGCERSAMFGQAHHITAWEDGGQTNQSNLMGLCGPHNAMNGRNGRGKMSRGPNGESLWHPPDGGMPVDTTNPDFGLSLIHI